MNRGFSPSELGVFSLWAGVFLCGSDYTPSFIREAQFALGSQRHLTLNFASASEPIECVVQSLASKVSNPNSSVLLQGWTNCWRKHTNMFLVCSFWDRVLIRSQDSQSVSLLPSSTITGMKEMCHHAQCDAHCSHASPWNQKHYFTFRELYAWVIIYAQ